MKSNTDAARAITFDHFNSWLKKEAGFTRSTMTRKKYSVQMKAFSENGLKRTNFKCSIKDYKTRKEYMKAKAVESKIWRDSLAKTVPLNQVE
jgi:uncharacterized protein YxeA